MREELVICMAIKLCRFEKTTQYMFKSNKPSSRQSSALKAKPTKANATGLVESVKGYFTNLSYHAEDIKKLPRWLFKPHSSPSASQTYHILGQRHSSIKQAQKHHESITWFSYRKGYSVANSEALHSDIGWGCLIRVAQMALAHSLSRYFLLRGNPVDQHYLITPFLDEEGPEFKYSLNQFVRQSEKWWAGGAGKWLSMTQVTCILEHIQNSTSLKGTENLKVKCFHQNIYLKDLLHYFKVQPCECLRKQTFCPKCIEKAHSHSKQQYLKKDMLLVVTAKLGLIRPDPVKCQVLLELIQLPIFAGCLGGIPDEARFITGKSSDQLTYLDPHYVSPAVDRMSLSHNLSSFRRKQMRMMPVDSIDPSVGICFYLGCPQDLQVLTSVIQRMSSKYKQECLISYEWDSSGEFELLQEDRPKNYFKLKEKYEDLELSFSDLNASMSQESSFLFE